MPVLRGEHRDALRDGEVEPEVHLPVDFLALVDVGAVVGEPRLDRGVAERLERVLPQHLRRRLLGQLRDRLGVRLPQVAVDAQERRPQIVGRRREIHVRRRRGDRRNDALQKAVVDLDPAAGERLRERAMVERRRRLVAGRVAREERDRRVQVLIVEQREERDLRRGVGLDAGARGREARGMSGRPRGHPTRRRRAWRDRRRTPRRRG